MRWILMLIASLCLASVSLAAPPKKAGCTSGCDCGCAEGFPCTCAAKAKAKKAQCLCALGGDCLCAPGKCACGGTGQEDSQADPLDSLSSKIDRFAARLEKIESRLDRLEGKGTSKTVLVSRRSERVATRRAVRATSGPVYYSDAPMTYSAPMSYSAPMMGFSGGGCGAGGCGPGGCGNSGGFRGRWR